MKWLVTGGCGFLGTNLVRRLVDEEGAAVRVVDDLSVGTPGDLERAVPVVRRAEGPGGEEGWPAAGEAQLFVADIRDADTAMEASRGADVIVHLAANTGVAPSVEDPRRDCTTNVLGTFNYLDACRRNGIGRFVLASSGAALGEQDPPLHEECVPHPISPYGASKLAGEAYCGAFHHSFGVDTVALRFSNVYGPGSDHKNSVVAQFIRRALEGRPLEIYGDGRNTRDFIYVDDLTDAVVRAGTRPDVGGEIFQIATNEETSVLALADLMVPVLEEAGLGPLEIVHTDPRVGDVRRNYADISKAERLLGWTARVGLADGVRRTLAWFLEEAGPGAAAGPVGISDAGGREG